MEGYIVNGSGRAMHIFQRKFPAMHKMALEEIWPVYEAAVKKDLSKKVVSEEEFVDWLNNKGLMRDGFKYISGSSANLEGDIAEATKAEFDENGISADGRLEYPSLEDAPSRVINKLTYNDIAALRIIDNPRKVLAQVNNISKLRRAFTVVRRAGRKAFLEKVIRERLQVLERLS